jgi:hypothetical protein
MTTLSCVFVKGSLVQLVNEDDEHQQQVLSQAGWTHTVMIDTTRWLQSLLETDEVSALELLLELKQGVMN